MKKQWVGESKKERTDNKKFRIGVLVCHLNLPLCVLCGLLCKFSFVPTSESWLFSAPFGPLTRARQKLQTAGKAQAILWNGKQPSVRPNANP